MRPVELHVGVPEGVLDALGPAERDAAGRRAEARIAQVLAELQIAGAPRCEIGVGTPGRPVRVTLDGVPVPLSQRALQDAWFAAASDRADVPAPPPVDVPRTAWEQIPEPARLATFLAEVAHEAAIARPDLLLGAAPAAVPGTPRWLEEQLVARWIGLGDPGDVEATAVRAQRLGRPPNETLEALAARLRPAEVRIELPSDGAADVVPGLAPGADVPFAPAPDTSAYLWLEAFGTSWHHATGMSVPTFRWGVSDAVPDGMCQVRVNAVASAPFLLLPAGQLFVGMAPEDLEEAGIGARPAYELPGSVASVVSAADRAAAGAVAEFVLDASEFALMLAFGRLRRWPAMLLDLDEVEHMLSGLALTLPHLHRILVDRYSTAECCGLLRACAREGIPIRDIAVVFEHTVSFYAATDDGALYEHVRRELRHLLADALADQGELHLIPVGDALEREAQDALHPEAIRDALWARTDADDGSCLVTHPGARAALRAVLEPEFPDNPVLAWGEVVPGWPVAIADELTPAT